MARSDRLALLLEDRPDLVPQAGRALALGLAPEGWLARLDPRCLDVAAPDRTAAQRFEGAGARVMAGDMPRDYPLALVGAHKDRGFSRGLIGTALAHAAPGATLIISGDKSIGIDALLKEVAGHLPPDEIRAKAHGKSALISLPANPPAALLGWADLLMPRQNQDGFWTAPGMFSPDRIDPGTAFLAEHLPASLAGHVADLGAGWGALSAAILQRCPKIERLDLVELDARALDLARRNIKDPRAHFVWEDVSAYTPEARLDAVVTNPPFHTGRAANHSLGQRFIAQAARLLKPSGQLFLVANRHLPYEAHLKTAFREVAQIADANGFKLMRAARPSPAPRQSRKL